MRSKDIYVVMSNEDDYFNFKYAGYNSNGNVIAYYVPRDMINVVLKEHTNLSSSGVYLLLNLKNNHINYDTKVYVGQAKNIIKRTNEHNRIQENWWNLAILIIKNNDISFSSDEILYLEKYMYDLIYNSNNIELYSDHRPSGASKISLRDNNNFTNDFQDIDMLIRVLGLPIFHMRHSYKKNGQSNNNSIIKEVSSDESIFNIIFYCKSRNSDAKATLEKDGRLKVIKGSKVSKKEFSSSFKKQGFLDKYLDLEKNKVIKNGVFCRDYIFSSPSSAAAIVYKSSANGKTMWKDINGKTLKEHLEKQNK
ncbi:DUF4357 domain-containing protein [Apilactobacillus ozensis]|uniref:DUF4357 domain-containing protein n=1 Tax=Apilactobacillus ozensis TaxID=866801 RepID=UPI0007053DCD|nr:DUF4357 domain-containing protein [Apilactobacillus ozensis]